MVLNRGIILSVGLSILLSVAAWGQTDSTADQMLTFCNQFKQIQVDIREQRVSPDSAARAFQDVMRSISTLLGAGDTCRPALTPKFVYPLRGYHPKYSIGGGGRGYRSGGFDLFDAEAKGSHPAHDLFIRDRNQDNLDDQTSLPVDLLSISEGMVVATETNWQPGSELRGGNFIWVYDPCLHGLFYYAHNNRVVVEPGQWVLPGQKLGEIGRTGFNAYKERSPTHVHMMFLRLTKDFLPEPENPISWLQEGELIGW